MAEYTITWFAPGIARIETQVFVGDSTEVFQLAMEAAEEWDCDGDHDGITVTDEAGRILYNLKPVRFDALTEAEVADIMRASFGLMRDEDFGL